MLNEFAYCPRLFYLEHVQAEFTDNEDTVEGRFRHRRVDRESTRQLGTTGPEHAGTDEAPVEQVTSLLLSAPDLGAVARLDLVELADDHAVPIDYKRGSKPDVPEGAYEPERVQLCLQGLILQENGYRSDHGFLYFTESRERVRIEFDEALVQRTRTLLGEATILAREGSIPPPLVDSPKCPRCSLVGICLPDEINFLSAHRSEVRANEVRRLMPLRSDASPIYVQHQGGSATKKGDELVVREQGKVMESFRLIDVSQVNILGNVQVTTQLVGELCQRDIPICYFSYGGWFRGMTRGNGTRNVFLRRDQYSTAADEARSLDLARQFVRGKILNSRTLVRRNHPADPSPVLKELSRLSAGTKRASTMNELLGLEGAAARAYFSVFAEMLSRKEGGEPTTFDFAGRNRRPPRDPVNCLLSFTYSMLARDLVVTCHGVGFDPYLGFLHQPRHGRPALALDLMEEFRPLICDSVVLQLINTSEIRPRDFVVRAGGCSLTRPGRKRVIEAYERRMSASITHPTFKYRVSYRRTLEIQARLLGRALSGEIPEYPPFRTR
jgi:CRISPR-associated protein Cas1